jgi:hypothetical protein
MRRTAMILAVLAMLAMPMLAAADDQGWMPPGWTPTLPARPTVDLVQLAQLLRAKGVLTDHEYAPLTHLQSASLSRPRQARAWTWEEIDNNPVLRAGRSGGN